MIPNSPNPSETQEKRTENKPLHLNVQQSEEKVNLDGIEIDKGMSKSKLKEVKKKRKQIGIIEDIDKEMIHGRFNAAAKMLM